MSHLLVSKLYSHDRLFKVAQHEKSINHEKSPVPGIGHVADGLGPARQRPAAHLDANGRVDEAEAQAAERHLEPPAERRGLAGPAKEALEQQRRRPPQRQRQLPRLHRQPRQAAVGW